MDRRKQEVRDPILGAAFDLVLERGEVNVRHDAQTLADIIVGALTGGIVNWTVDKTYSLETGGR
jgi:hypothetical protein